MEFFPKVIVRFIFWSVVTQGHGSWTGKVCLSTKSRLYKVYKGLSLIMEFFPKVFISTVDKPGAIFGLVTDHGSWTGIVNLSTKSTSHSS